MSGKKHSTSGGCLPLTIGLLIGLLISYGIRFISSQTFVCKQHQVILDESSEILPLGPSILPETPDQVVNLAFSSRRSHKKRKNQDQEMSSSSPTAEKDKLLSSETAGNHATLEAGAKIQKQQKKETKMCLDEKTEHCTTQTIDEKNRDLLFVGVMTARSYLGNRAKAVWNTWAKDIPGKVVFFTGGSEYTSKEQVVYDSESKGVPREVVQGVRNFHSNESLSQIPLVALPGVDDSYPPQKKSFMMLKYMYEHYGNDFEWFMRADDDVYVRSGKLSEFLRSIDSRELYFIGQAGKGNRMEKGTLNLAHNENFCMGGPGIIFSRPTLAKVAPRVQDCLKDMYSTHEDVEVGRCVQRFAGISCTWAYEMQTIFHHNSSGDLAFTGKLKRREVHKAITLHPVKNSNHLYRLHSYFKSLEIQELNYEKLSIHRDLLSLSEYGTTSTSPNPKSQFRKRSGFSIVDFSSILSEDYDFRVTGLPVGLNKFKPLREDHILKWDFFGKGVFSTGTISPKHKNTGDGKEALEDVVRELMDIINGYSRVRGRVIDFKEILYGYRRVNPLHGVDYILDLFMTYKKYRGRKLTIPVRRHIYLQRPFGPLQIRSISQTEKPRSSYFMSAPSRQMKDQETMSVNNNASSSYADDSPRKRTKMTMIVPLSGRYETFHRFLDSFSNACVELKTSSMKVTSHKDITSSRKRHRTPVNVNETNSAHSSGRATFPSIDLSLIVVFFGTDLTKEKYFDLVKEQRERMKSLLSSFQSDAKDESCNIKVVQIDGPFSRAIALETGISQCHENDLLFLIDVDLIFTAAGLRRVLMNTVQNQQVYFPVVFSQYNPKYYDLPNDNDLNRSYTSRKHKVESTPLVHTVISSTSSEAEKKSMNGLLGKKESSKLSSLFGCFREFGYGIASFYKSDFRLAGGFDTSIKGWGKEDVALFDRFVHHTNLTIFRAPDPDLVHVFHPTECDKSLPRTQFEMCTGSRANTLGSSESLMEYIFRNKHTTKGFGYIFE